MEGTDGLRRGEAAEVAAGPINVPVGRCTLGRIFNVLGEPVDGKGDVSTEVRRAIHRPAPSYVDLETTRAIFETGIKVVDGCAPYKRGGKIGLFGDLSALTVAEYFREDLQQDVLLFIDNIFRFVQAGSEVSALLGRLTSAVGYQPTLATEMGSFQERITSTRNGSMVPAPATTFIHLDATTVLARSLAAKGIYPAVDVLDSTSTMLQPWIVGDAHYE